MFFGVKLLHGYFQYQMWTYNLWTRSVNGFKEIRVILQKNRNNSIPIFTEGSDEPESGLVGTEVFTQEFVTVIISHLLAECNLRVHKALRLHSGTVGGGMHLHTWVRGPPLNQRRRSCCWSKPAL